MSIMSVLSRAFVCFSLAILVAGCSSSTAPEATDQGAAEANPLQTQLQTYVPFADKLKEILQGAYEPGPLGLTAYEQLVQELATTAEQREPFTEASGLEWLAFEERVPEVLASHQATLTAGLNFAKSADLIKQYQEGVEVESNPELKEAVDRAFPEGPPAPEEMTPIDKFDAKNAMIDVKWSHVRTTTAATREFLDEFRKLQRSADVLK